MDNLSFDVCKDFSSIFRISKPVENDTNLPHPRFAKYCPKARLNAPENGIERLQEKRRNEHFENLKRKRENLLANLRKLITITENRTPSPPLVEEEPMSVVPQESQPQACDVQMKTVADTGTKGPSPRRKRNHHKTKESFEKLVSKQLMLSEWLVDVPEDLYEEWFMVSCPVGRRCIVIAAKGDTKVYSRSGRLLTQFQSHLPAGSKKNVQKTRKSTILDCIFVEQQHKFFILDVISWNGCTFFDCDTEFRFFWLHTRFNEEVRDAQSAPDTQASYSKLYSFEPLTYLECRPENLIQLVGSEEQQSQIDGVLFYNKHSPYTPGVTPLVCWLKIPMISQILKL